MTVCNLIEYSATYSKTVIGLWHFYRHESALDNNKAIFDFLADNNNSILFKYKQQIKKQTRNSGAEDFQFMV